MQLNNCPASAYCYVYSILSTACNTSHGNATLARIIESKCLIAYKRSAKTKTEIALSPTLTFNGFSADDLRRDKSAQQAIIEATKKSCGGDANVTILNITSSSSRRLDDFVFRRNLAGSSVNILLLIKALAEHFGYASQSANAAATQIQSNLQTSVSSGSFTQQLADIASSQGSGDFFSDVNVSPDIVPSPTTIIQYLETSTPTVSPTPSPTITTSPTVVPTSAAGGSSSRRDDTNAIIISVTVVVGTIFIGLLAVLCLCSYQRQPVTAEDKGKSNNFRAVNIEVSPRQSPQDNGTSQNKRREIQGQEQITVAAEGHKGLDISDEKGGKNDVPHLEDSDKDKVWPISEDNDNFKEKENSSVSKANKRNSAGAMVYPALPENEEFTHVDNL